jgi:hypothetical protein
MRELGGAGDLENDTVSHECVIEMELGGDDPVGAAGIGLGIDIDEQGGPLGRRQGRGQVDGGRRLADPALLVDDGKDLAAPSFRCRDEGANENIPPGDRLSFPTNITPASLSSSVPRGTRWIAQPPFLTS